MLGEGESPTRAKTPYQPPLIRVQAHCGSPFFPHPINVGERVERAKAVWNKALFWFRFFARIISSMFNS